MKGVLLCGREGTRLRPLTEVVNKHILRVGNLPMAEHPLRKIQQCDIRDVLIVSGGSNFSAVVKYFGSGKKWGMRFVHAIQDEAGGIAQALSMAESFVGDERVLVLLGDNLFSMNLHPSIYEFCNWIGLPRLGAQLYTIRSENAERFGVFRYENGQPVAILEKPNNPTTDGICTGIYCYEPDVFEIIKTLKPSGRGELEITDVNNIYLKECRARVVPMTGWWTDCGTMETLRTAEKLLND